MLTLPNILTIGRIAAIPLLVAAFYLPFPVAQWTAFGLFLAASITDFFDGYLARRWGQVSALGRFLDPVADKLIVAAVLLMLVHVGTIGGAAILPALIILVREIVVSGLREYLAEIRVGLPVSRLAKWKTATQMTAICILLVGTAGPAWLPLVGIVCLWVAGGLTLITGWDYLSKGLKHMLADTRPNV